MGFEPDPYVLRHPGVRSGLYLLHPVEGGQQMSPYPGTRVDGEIPFLPLLEPALRHDVPPVIGGQFLISRQQVAIMVAMGTPVRDWATGCV